MEDWAEIRRLHFAEKLGIKTISKRLSISRNTVRAAVRTATPPTYRRRRRPSAVDPYEHEIRALLKGCSTMRATVIAERIEWPRGMTILKERVAEIRPLYLEPDPFQAHRLPPRRARPVGHLAARRRHPGRLRATPLVSW